MTEPTGTITFVLTGAAAAALGPVFGPYTLIAFAAAVGSLLAMSSVPMESRWHGVRFVVVGMLVALVLTAPCVWAVDKYTPVPGNVALMPMAFILGVARKGVLGLVEKLLSALGSAFEVFLTALAARKGQGDSK